jgi:GxxExxY protein
MKDNDLTGKIIQAAMKIHTALGPGLLESAYEACLEYELDSVNLLRPL